MEPITGDGCITTENELFGNAGTLLGAEKLLGYREGRFSEGVKIGYLKNQPTNGWSNGELIDFANKFSFGGYNQVEINKFKSDFFSKQSYEREIDFKKRLLLAKIDVIKKVFIPNRMVKVFPNILHSEKETYPPGGGIRQYKLLVKFDFEIGEVFSKSDYPNAKITHAKLYI